MNEKGMILPVIILMISFMLLAASYFFSTAVFSFSLTKNQYQQALNLQKAQLSLKPIISEIEEGASCEIPFQNNARFIAEPLSWWQTQACDQGEEIYYVYMIIHEAPCDFVEGHSVSYVEVLIRAGNKRKSMLGALLALPSKKPVTCIHLPHEVSKKVLSEFLLA